MDSDLIKTMNPYAAYSVTDDTWAVPPARLPDDPGEAFPASWWEAVGRDAEAAQKLSEAYARHTAIMAAHHPETAPWRNAEVAATLARQQAAAMFDDIHLGRRYAFSPQGKGYGDYTNFRWQALKRNGTVAVLHGIVSEAAAVRRDTETSLYGAPLDAADVVLRRAAQQHRGRP